ncbi:MAG: hypothetical protein Q8L66_02100 [Caulobacter sp.]|nr:hypothetical protein [Caulobacter sp.]
MPDSVPFNDDVLVFPHCHPGRGVCTHWPVRLPTNFLDYARRKLDSLRITRCGVERGSGLVQRQRAMLYDELCSLFRRPIFTANSEEIFHPVKHAHFSLRILTEKTSC